MTTIRMSANAAAGRRSGCPEMRVCAVVIAHSACMQVVDLSSASQKALPRIKDRDVRPGDGPPLWSVVSSVAARAFRDGP
jgi:hypothetical protein